MMVCCFRLAQSTRRGGDRRMHQVCLVPQSRDFTDHKKGFYRLSVSGVSWIWCPCLCLPRCPSQQVRVRQYRTDKITQYQEVNMASVAFQSVLNGTLDMFRRLQRAVNCCVTILRRWQLAIHVGRRILR